MDTTRAPKNTRLTKGIPLDEARLRPHLRQVQPPAAFTPGHLDTLPLPALQQGATVVPSPGELRGIPVIGHGGAIPGTDPAKQFDKSAA